MLGALTNRTRVTTAALLRAVQLDAGANHEQRSAPELFPLWSNANAPCAITVLLFTTEIKQCAPFSPSRDGSFKLEITFCVRGVLSPLLSNLVLDELDRELERRQHRFVRYADDCNIYVASERAGKRVMQSVTSFIRRRLKLKVNEAKSAVARPQERKFLGFSFTYGARARRRIAPKALLRCKQRVRELTRRTQGISLQQMTKELASYLRGWKGYFGYCQTPSVLQRLDEWIRHRLRSVIWKQWKRGSTRFVRLRQRNIGRDLAAQTAGSPHGPWRLANSPALSIAFPAAYFDALGLPRLMDVAPAQPN
jgi:RNA-directed DNA polymerase